MALGCTLFKGNLYMASVSRKSSISKRTAEYGKEVVKNYNKRVKYYAQKGYEAPSPVRWSDMTKYYKGNEKALRSRLRDLKQYNRKNATETMSVGKYGVKVNKYLYKSLMLNKDDIIKQINRDIKKSEYRDKAEGFRLPSERTRELIARKETIQYGTRPTSTKVQLYAAMRRVKYYTEQRLNMDEQFYINFMEMFTTQAELSNTPPEVLYNIEQQFRRLTPQDLLELFETEPDIKQIVNNYNLAKEGGEDFMTKSEQRLERNKFKELSEYLPTLVTNYLERKKENYKKAKQAKD